MFHGGDGIAGFAGGGLVGNGAVLGFDIALGAGEGAVGIVGVGHEEEGFVIGFDLGEEFDGVFVVECGVAAHGEIVGVFAVIPGEFFVGFEVGGFAEDAEVVAGGVEGFFEGGAVIVDGDEADGAGAVGVATGHEGFARGLADGDGDVGEDEAHGLFGEGVEVGGDIGAIPRATSGVSKFMSSAVRRRTLRWGEGAGAGSAGADGWGEGKEGGEGGGEQGEGAVAHGGFLYEDGVMVREGGMGREG